MEDKELEYVDKAMKRMIEKFHKKEISSHVPELSPNPKDAKNNKASGSRKNVPANDAQSTKSGSTVKGVQEAVKAPTKTTRAGANKWWMNEQFFALTVAG